MRSCHSRVGTFSPPMHVCTHSSRGSENKRACILLYGVYALICFFFHGGYYLFHAWFMVPNTCKLFLTKYCTRVRNTYLLEENMCRRAEKKMYSKTKNISVIVFTQQGHIFVPITVLWGRERGFVGSRESSCVRDENVCNSIPSPRPRPRACK